MNPFIMFKSTTTNISYNNGTDILCLLTPSVAEYSIEYNGAGTLRIEHPADAEGKWKSIQCGNIIFAPIMRRNQDFPQPFRVYKVTKTRRNGLPVVIADCMHVFYDLNYCTVYGRSPQSTGGQWSGYTADEWLNGKDIGGGEIRGLPIASDWATWMHRYWHGRDNLFWDQGDSDYWRPAYQLFTRSSNVTGTFTFYCNGETLTEHLIGNGNSVSNITGGILFADKYRFSLNSPMEGSQSNAFSIAYGLNLEGITQTIDGTNVITLLDNDTNLTWTAAFPFDYVKPGVKYAEQGFAFSREAPAKFNYSGTTDSSSPAGFRDDSAKYFQDRSAPTIAYSVQLSARQVSDEIANLATYEVGDSGTIYDPDLDISTSQKIVKKTVDLITQRVKSVELSSLGRQRYKAQWSRTITSGQEALEKRINSMEASS